MRDSVLLVITASAVVVWMLFCAALHFPAWVYAAVAPVIASAGYAISARRAQQK